MLPLLKKLEKETTITTYIGTAKNPFTQSNCPEML